MCTKYTNPAGAVDVLGATEEPKAKSGAVFVCNDGNVLLAAVCGGAAVGELISTVSWFCGLVGCPLVPKSGPTILVDNTVSESKLKSTKIC